jgi:hypothetical protein
MEGGLRDYRVVCVFVLLFRLFHQNTDFHETQYEHCALGSQPRATPYRFLESRQQMAHAGTCEVGATLAACNIAAWLNSELKLNSVA